MGAIKITSVGFDPTPLSPKTLVIKHRLTSDPDVDGSYITDGTDVPVGIDGILSPEFVISGLLNGTSYTVSVVSSCGGVNAKQEFVTECGCPSGFVPSDDSGRCEKVETESPTVTHTDYCLAISRNGAYANRFARIYNVGFSNSSIALISAPLSDVYAEMTLAPYWANPTLSTTLGVMNRNSVWIDSNCDGVKNALSAGEKATIAYNFNNAGAPRTIYIGVGADNQFVLKVNGTVIAQTTVPNSAENFKIFHIFPVDIISGNNDINVVATGDGSVNDAIAMVVYDNTRDEIKNATQDSDVEILFSSSELVGQHIDIATCRDGWSLDTSAGQGNYVCRKLTIVDCAGFDDPLLL